MCRFVLTGSPGIFSKIGPRMCVSPCTHANSLVSSSLTSVLSFDLGLMPRTLCEGDLAMASCSISLSASLIDGSINSKSSPINLSSIDSLSTSSRLSSSKASCAAMSSGSYTVWKLGESTAYPVGSSITSLHPMLPTERNKLACTLRFAGGMAFVDLNHQNFPCNA